MATVEEVLKIASEEIGTGENPRGSNMTKYGAAYGMNGVSWCAQFVWWVMNKAGVEHIKSAYTPSVADWYRSKGRGFSDDKQAKRGDIVLFDFPDSLHRIQHIGFVVENTGSSLMCIEGNTSAGSSGSQDNGDGVYRKPRDYGSAVYYGRPFYAAEPPPVKLGNIPVRVNLEVGDVGADVKRLQRYLNIFSRLLDDKTAFDPFALELDKSFGADTERAVKAFQRWYSKQHPKAVIEPTGVADVNTLNRLADVVENAQDKTPVRR